MRAEHAMEEFVQASWPGLVRFAWTLVGDRGHAEDVVQAVLARSWTRWTEIDPERAEAYLRAAVVNESISRYRWLRRRPSETPFPESFSLEGAAVSDLADDRARHAVIWDELQSLPARMRAVVVLRFLEDLSEARTAEILGCTVGTVKSQTSRAMARLRERSALRDLAGASDLTPKELR